MARLVETGGRILAVALLVMPFVGCGGRTVGVSGAVTFNGRPVEQGTIVFEPADGKGATLGGRIDNGRYAAGGQSGVLPGRKIVRIRGTRRTGRQVPAGPPAPAGTMVDEVEQIVPAEYGSESQTIVDIGTGRVNRHDFHLESKP